MKLFSYILSVYILVLNAYPCIDVPAGNHLTQTECGQNIPSEEHHDLDHCSPFCTCTCCTSPVFQQTFIVKIEIPPVFSKTSFEYLSSYIFFHSESIWQPPKLS